MQMWLEDVTHRPALRQIAQDMAASNYCQLYGDSSQLLKANEMWPESKFVGMVPYYRTLMMFGKERDDLHGIPLATITCRLGSQFDGTGPPLEFMKYMTPAGGWEGYLNSTLNPRTTLEISMFAFTESISGPDDLNTRIQIFREMHSCVLAIGKELGCDTFWSILTRTFARFVAMYCHLPCDKIDGMSLNESDCSDLFDLMPKYWRIGKPGIYITYSPAQTYISPCSEEIIE